MQTAHLETRTRANSLARAILSGFVASVAMLFTFMLAYGMATLLSGVEVRDRRGAETLRQWLTALTDNNLIDFALPNLYAGMAVHFAVGLGFALLYAHVFEPRMRYASWLSGLIFSFVPWLLSVVVFLPLVGGGLFGFALGAGPLPLMGNFVLHAVYGTTLGVLYGPFGDLITDSSFEPPHGDDIAAMEGSERAAARGTIIGMVVGVAISLIATLAAQTGLTGTLFGMNPLAFLVSTALLGSAFGALIGSLVGLPSGPDAR